jgi:hypothetical protein
MNQEINRINQVLPNAPANEKSDAIQGWIISVIDRMENYKVEHNRLVNEATTLLELAVWKAKLNEKEEAQAKKSKIDVKVVRMEKRITSGADIIIKNVVPFLKLE